MPLLTARLSGVPSKIAMTKITSGSRIPTRRAQVDKILDDAQNHIHEDSLLQKI